MSGSANTSSGSSSNSSGGSATLVLAFEQFGATDCGTTSSGSSGSGD